MTQKSQGLVWGFIIHSARSSHCGTRKKGRGGDGQGRGYLGPACPGMNPCLALVPLTTAFVPSAGEAALGTSTPRERRQQESSLHLGPLPGDGQTLASLESPFEEEKSEMPLLLPPHCLQSV